MTTKNRTAFSQSGGYYPPKGLKKEKKEKLYSILFLFIFLVKMIVAAAPLILSSFDKHTTNAAIMQLEIENNAKSPVSKQVPVNDYLTAFSWEANACLPIKLFLSTLRYANRSKHIQTFYPPVPTPPPNV